MLDDYGLAMLKAGADLSDKSLEDLTFIRCKRIRIGRIQATVAQVNAVDIEDVLGRQAELEALLTKNVEENDLDLFFFVVTDILNNDSTAVAVGKVAEASAKAFGAEIVAGRIALPGVVSRKKQIVPVLTDGLK